MQYGNKDMEYLSQSAYNGAIYSQVILSRESMNYKQCFLVDPSISADFKTFF